MKLQNAELIKSEGELRAYCTYLETLVAQNAERLADNRRTEEELRRTSNYLEKLNASRTND